MQSLPIQLTFHLALLVVFAGCTGDSTSTESPTPPPSSNADDAHAGHDHPSEGPHHGSLVELGNEEYHAEVLHDDDAATVTIYILDGTANAQVPIAASEITINAKHDGQPVQFKLAASPDTKDPEGKSSRFVSSDRELAERMDEDGTEPRLVLSIDGKSYRGAISHDHGDH